jgi:hypothetical protein
MPVMDVGPVSVNMCHFFMYMKMRMRRKLFKYRDNNVKRPEAVYEETVAL